MFIEVLTKWVQLDIIRYLMIATTTIGLLNCIKLLVKGR